MFTDKRLFMCHESLVFYKNKLFNLARCQSTQRVKSFRAFKSVGKDSSFKQCIRCNFGSFSPVWYYFHKKKCNLDNKSTISTNNVTKLRHSHECDHCKFTTRRKRNAKAQLTKKHIHLAKCEPNIYKVRKQTPINHQQSFRCTQCVYSSSTENYLKNHITRKHAPNKLQKWFYCDECNFKTLYKIILRFHKDQHASSIDLEKNFQCTQCEYKFLTKLTLHNHVKKKHTPIDLTQSVQSNHCEYKSFFKDALKAHNKIQINKKPSHLTEWLLCEKCEFKTLYVRAFKAHKDIHVMLEGKKLHQPDQYEFKA